MFVISRSRLNKISEEDVPPWAVELIQEKNMFSHKWIACEKADFVPVSLENVVALPDFWGQDCGNQPPSWLIVAQASTPSRVRKLLKSALSKKNRYENSYGAM